MVGKMTLRLTLGACAAAVVLAAQTRSLDIYWIDVEGGGATLIVSPTGQSLLVDAGNPGNGDRDAKRVFAYIKRLQASSTVWNAETSNCTSFIGDIAEFMGLKTPSRWTRPEAYVNELKALNSGREMVRLSEQ